MNFEDFKSQITILSDSREQRNQHVLEALNQDGIKFKSKGLKFGDYSFSFDGTSYEKEVILERKATLTELAGNFCSGRKRFEAEFIKATEAGAKVILLVEDADGREKMILRRTLDADKSLTADARQKKTWRSNFTANSMIASIASWKEKYNFSIIFCNKKETAGQMLKSFYEYFVGKDNNNA